MKVILLTGSHPRHLYVVNQLVKLGIVVAHVIEKREEFVPQLPAYLKGIDRDNFIRHFKDRETSEQQFFTGHSEVSEKIPTLEVSKQTLNSIETIKWVEQFDADLAVSYGVHKLNDELLNSLPAHSWNIHGGLSPWFKGNTTLFWPFYMLRPNWAGMTIHRLSSRLDAGHIVHHSVPKLAYGNGIHDVASKAVMQVAEDLCSILSKYSLDEIEYVPQKGNGKLYVSTDWTPQHLRIIYQTFNNDIVDHYLDGKLPNPQPSLVNALKGDA